MAVPADQIVAAYKDTGSIWKAGKRLGLCGQTVHERLRTLGYTKLLNRRWEADELAELTALAGHTTIGEIARRLGRPYAGVALMISRCGLASNFGNRGTRKIRRGAGYDKATTRKRLRALMRFDRSLRSFCVAQSIDVESFVQACQRHFPDRWTEYTRIHADLKSAVCPYCKATYYPMSKKQRSCTRKCAETARRDTAYFGGNRRKTIGLADGVCQLCGVKKERGLSSHHLIGKENDPENELLIALCPGCHHVVGQLAGRRFVDTPAGWENLINLVVLRRRGPVARAARDSEPIAVNSYVDIEWLTRDDIEQASVTEEAPPVQPL